MTDMKTSDYAFRGSIITPFLHITKFALDQIAQFISSANSAADNVGQPGGGFSPIIRYCCNSGADLVGWPVSGTPYAVAYFQASLPALS